MYDLGQTKYARRTGNLAQTTWLGDYLVKVGLSSARSIYPRTGTGRVI